MAKRSTIYFDPEIHKALRVKTAHTGHSISYLVNEVVRQALSEERENLSAVEERAGEPTLPLAV